MILAFQIGLNPTVFWDLTPFEFQCAVEGHSRTLKHQQQLLAWTQANIMNCWTKKRITPQKLLGAKEFERGTTPEQLAKYYASKRQRFGRSES